MSEAVVAKLEQVLRHVSAWQQRYVALGFNVDNDVAGHDEDGELEDARKTENGANECLVDEAHLFSDLLLLWGVVSILLVPLRPERTVAQSQVGELAGDLVEYEKAISAAVANTDLGVSQVGVCVVDCNLAVHHPGGGGSVAGLPLDQITSHAVHVNEHVLRHSLGHEQVRDNVSVGATTKGRLPAPHLDSSNCSHRLGVGHECLHPLGS